jgi:hypothetical protein
MNYRGASQIRAPQFDHDTARDFLTRRYANEPAALMLGYSEGICIPPGDAHRFDSVLARAQREQNHLFFHVATLKPEWDNPSSHDKGKVTTASKDKAILSDGTKNHILECSFVWLDCDCAKYAGSDQAEADAHYERERTRVSKKFDDGLSRLSIVPWVKWCSGGGWQALIKLDKPLPPADAEEIVGRLHTALGFDPTVRNCNRILRVPGSVNWKGRAS